MRVALLATEVESILANGMLVTKRVTRIEAQWLKHSQSFSIPDKLTDEQQNVLDSIAKTMGNGYSSHLLHGVTGSGKTEVYIQLIMRAIEQGGSALILVPEISLTPQTAARLISRFPNQKAAILHSTLTRAQRHQQWALISEGKADIILGVRSAVFAPIPEGKLKLIIVDEEHESSYKQDSAPRYNGRDIAIRRAWMSKCPIVLGSATPSMESWWNATVRNISSLHTLKHRAPGLVIPSIELINMKHEFTDDGQDFALFSDRLVEAMKAQTNNLSITYVAPHTAKFDSRFTAENIRTLSAQSNTQFVIIGVIDDLSMGPKDTPPVFTPWRDSTPERAFSMSLQVYDGINGGLLYTSSYRNQEEWTFDRFEDVDEFSSKLQ